jgi:predicted phage tail protein
MLTTIYLSGEAGHRFGRKFKFAVSSPAEAVRAIEANHPGFLDYLAQAGDRGIAFRVKVDGEVIDQEKLAFQRRKSVIRISPVVAGSKDETTGIIIGVVLVVAAVVAQQYGLLPGILSGIGPAAAGGAQAGLTGGWLGTFVGALGVGMAIGGVSQILAPQPGIPADNSGSGRPSYLFSGPVNSVQQGGPVPLCYGGPIIVGSQVISAGIHSEDISGTQRGAVPEGPFTDEPDYPDYEEPTPPTNLIARSLQTRQFARFLDALCEGKIAGLCDRNGNILSYDDRNKGILFEGTQVLGDDGVSAFNEFSTAFRPGSVTQDPIPGFPAAESETAVETEVIKGSDKIANAVQRTIAAGGHNAIRVSILIPALYRIDDKGNRLGHGVHFGIQIKRSVDSVWTEVVGSNPLPNGEIDGLVQGESTEPNIYEFRIPLPGTGPWDVRVLKENADDSDPATQQSRVFWRSYTLITDGKFTYRHTALAASEISAEKFSSQPNRWFRLKGKLVRVPSNYNPATRNYTGAWDGKFAGADLTVTSNYSAGASTLQVAALAASLSVDSPIEIEQGGITSHAYLLAGADAGATSLTITPINRAITAGAIGFGFELKWTSCPPWIFYDLCIEKRYGLGDYIPRTHVDRWALYTIARYCDGVDSSGNFVGVPDGRGGFEPRFAISVYIQGMQDAYRVLSDLASAFRGMIYFGAGVISAVQDAPKSPRFNFHDGNVIDGNFHYSTSAVKSRHTRVRVQFSDPENFYKSDFEVVDADDADIERFGIRETSVTAFGCTSRAQAQRLGKWILLTEKLEKETVIFSTGMQGARARPGDIVRVRDRAKTVNVMAGRLAAVGGGSVTLDSPVVLGGGSYTLLVTKSDGTFADLAVTTGAGTHTTLAVTGDLTGIVAFTDWILRTSTLEPVLFRVLNVRETDRHQFEITALRYAESKFAIIEEGIEISEPSTSDLPTPEVPASPATVTIELTAVDTPSGTQRFLNASWTASTSKFVDGYIVEYRPPGGEWKEVEARAKGLAAKPVLVTALGEHSFRVFTVNTLGFVSTPGTAVSLTVGEMTNPDPPTGLVATPQVHGIFLQWDNPDSPDLTVIEVQESLTGSFNDPPAGASPIVGTAVADAGTKGAFGRNGITSDMTRHYRIRARNKSGGKSTWTSSESATATVPPTGAPGSSVELEYSVDGISWHFPFATGDLYMRQRVAGGDWSTAIRIVGEPGTPGAAGTRGSRSFYRALSGAATWSDTEAEAAITAMSLTKVTLDTVTLYKTSANYAETKFWTGTTWDPVAMVLDGNLVVHGTIGGDQLVAGISIVTPLIIGGLLRLNGDCTIAADTSDGSDNSLVRLNGGGSDGQGRGGQVDVIGNEYTTVAGYNGSVLITPGNHANGSARIRDRTGNDRIVVRTDGDVEMDADLDVSGGVEAGSFNKQSSRRLKKNITELKNALEIVRQLRGVRFDWKRKDIKNDFGFIAEEVAKVLPSAVSRGPEGRITGVDYGHLTAVLAPAIRDLDTTVRRLERRLARRGL